MPRFISLDNISPLAIRQGKTYNFENESSKILV